MNININRFKGLLPALLTPYDKNGKISSDSLQKLIDNCIGQGVDGFYVGGSTGEAFLLTTEERKLLIKLAMEAVAGKKPVICQVGAVGTDIAIDLAQWAEKNGADAISAVAPFYYPFSKEQILNHYTAITDSVSIPMIVYNIPGLSGVSLSEDDFKRLYEHDRIIGVKHTHHNLYEMERIKSIDPERLVFFGFDEVTLAGVAMGADGAIGSTFNLMAAQYIRLRELFNQGKNTEALEKQKMINNIISTMIPMGVFTALKYAITSRRGIPMGEVRAPFTPLSGSEKSRLDTVLDKYGI
ncbi:MAG: N-acetylneuraminate lyase [Spirochaetaceae bacterium]|nr:N-acetylneuraminate lyase [Spirochaetaceae bacterium]RKX88882.1 MAG: N-acetylneuraminate lyase [Spirochaetota bacterium]RKX97763.1 MAG: N-acetylneuraminate lyase [Spirochaetota bacterium]